MKNALFLVQAAAVMALVVGCADNNKGSTTKGTAALDITPPPAHAQPVTPAYTPAPTQPVTIAPVDAAPAVTAAPAASSASAGGSYTVKKGDTLYSIARNRYGDGKQYTRIVSANPGLSPTTLKVGQQIVIP